MTAIQTPHRKQQQTLLQGSLPKPRTLKTKRDLKSQKLKLEYSLL